MGADARRFAAPALGVLTALALLLRLPGMGQSLAGDEYFTHTIVTRSGLGGVWHDVFHTSITPPLHYVVAWVFVQFGGDTATLVRVPSLILGTALVPLVFLLARRAGGTAAGLLAAAAIALGPFSIWYSDEARAYALMMFLVALSTFALLRALDDGRRGWWAVYAVAACAALWAHYTAVFVVATEAGWALWTHRDRWRPLVGVQVAIVLGFAPWIPGFLQQRRNKGGIEVIGALVPQTVPDVVVLPLRLLVGHPEWGLRTFPGTTGLVLAVLAIALVALAVWRRPPAWREAGDWMRSERGLLLMLALATPVGLILYAAAGTSLFLPRNLSASLPALAALTAVLAVALARSARLGRPVVVVGLVLIAAVLALDAARALSPDRRRAPFRQAATFIDRTSPTADPVVELTSLVIQPGDARLPSALTSIYFRRGRPVYPYTNAAAGWAALSRGRAVHLITPGGLAQAITSARLGRDVTLPPDLLRRIERLGGPDGRAISRGARSFRGEFPVVVRRYRGLAQGRLRQRTLSWTLAPSVPVVAGAVRGQAVAGPAGVLGWAVTSGPSPRAAEWVLGFRRGRLIAVSPGGQPRIDIAQRFGLAAVLSGFSLAGTPDRVVAISGGRASRLPLR